MYSDINTDTDEKAHRKIRARKVIDTDEDKESDSDNETCLPPYPKVPPVRKSKYSICF